MAPFDQSGKHKFVEFDMPSTERQKRCNQAPRSAAESWQVLTRQLWCEGCIDVRPMKTSPAFYNVFMILRSLGGKICVRKTADPQIRKCLKTNGVYLTLFVLVQFLRSVSYQLCEVSICLFIRAQTEALVSALKDGNKSRRVIATKMHQKYLACQQVDPKHAVEEDCAPLLMRWTFAESPNIRKISKQVATP